MTEIQIEIHAIISNVWIENPDLRFGQLLFGLNIVEFADKLNPENKEFNLSDVFYDSDLDMLNRIKSSKLYKQYQDKNE